MSSGKGAVVSYSCQDAVKGWVMASIGSIEGGVGVYWNGCGFIHLSVLFPLELEKQMKIENLFVTWQQRSAQSNMPISVSADWAFVQSAGKTSIPFVGGSIGAQIGIRAGDGIWLWSSALCLNFWACWPLELC